MLSVAVNRITRHQKSYCLWCRAILVPYSSSAVSVVLFVLHAVHRQSDALGNDHSGITYQVTISFYSSQSTKNLIVVTLPDCEVF